VSFELGADDHIVKPFCVRELMLRIEVALRRGRSRGEREVEAARCGVLQIDEAAHRVWVDGAEVALTSLELRLLCLLHHRSGRVQSRAALIEGAWGWGADVEERTVDTHLRHLREKLGSAGEYLETIRGEGYRFRGPTGPSDP